MIKDDLPKFTTTCWVSRDKCPLCGKEMVSCSRYRWCNDANCKHAEIKTWKDVNDDRQ